MQVRIIPLRPNCLALFNLPPKNKTPNYDNIKKRLIPQKIPESFRQIPPV
jgi:hypothetical protein